MFGRKSDSPEIKEDTKACETCGCVVLTAKLEQVKYWRLYSRTTSYYCGRCKPPYDRITYCLGGDIIYERRIPEHFVFVTREGATIVKCEKVKSKRVAKNTKE